MTLDGGSGRFREARHFRFGQNCHLQQNKIVAQMEINNLWFLTPEYLGKENAQMIFTLIWAQIDIFMVAPHFRFE